MFYLEGYIKIELKMAA